MKRKALALILALVMITSIFSISALADSSTYVTPASTSADYITFKNAYGNNYRVDRTISVTTGSSYTGYVVVIQDCMNLFYERTGNSYYYVGRVDGQFGTNTFNAVCTFQANMGLSPVDGIVGYGTWTTLHTRWQLDLGGCNLPHLTL